MKIAIIGAGFTGLASAWDLVRHGHEVTLFEASSAPGGLASGFRKKQWSWTAEHHYHHIFRSDADIIQLCREMKCEDMIFFRRVKTSTVYKGSIFQLDSPQTLLSCSHLSVFSRLRVAGVLAFLRLFTVWRILERYTASDFLQRTMGKQAWEVLWEPLFMGKFGRYAGVVNAAWFWARIHVRSAELGYFTGGFLAVAERMVEALTRRGVICLLGTQVENITSHSNGVTLILKKKLNSHREKLSTMQFDKVLVTMPAPLFSVLCPQLPKQYTQSITNLVGIGAVTLVLELKTPFFSDGTYWLNVNERKWPFLAVVEHTQFVGTQGYAGHSIVYVGKYCEKSNQLFNWNAKQIYTHYAPFLRKLSPHFEQHLVGIDVFKAPFAQPIVPVAHGCHLPQYTTPLPHVWWASMQHVYPHDRGTNYAVRLGRQVAQDFIPTNPEAIGVY